MKPKVIHTKTFSCADDHPIVYYTVDKENKAVCEYCYTKFLYEPKDFHTKMPLGRKKNVRHPKRCRTRLSLSTMTMLIKF